MAFQLMAIVYSHAMFLTLFMYFIKNAQIESQVSISIYNIIYIYIYIYIYTLMCHLLKGTTMLLKITPFLD